MRGIKFWIITLLGLFISVVLKGQYVEIIGTFNVCPNQVYTYEVDILDPDACLYGIEWTIDGGEIQNSATSEELKVIWDDTGGEIAVSVDISYRVNCDAKDDNFDTSQPITSKSKLSGSFTSFNIIQNEVSNPTSLSFCDICNLSVNAITDEKNNQVRYYWKYSTNGSDFHHLRTTTSNSTNAIIENLQEVDNTQDSIIYFKVIAYSLCSSYYETIGTVKKKIKYCFEHSKQNVRTSGARRT